MSTQSDGVAADFRAMPVKELEFIGAYQDFEDRVQKYIFKDENGILEISHIHNKDRDTYCIPSFYGCTLGCKFCHITTEKLCTTMVPISVDTINCVLSRIPRTKTKELISIMGMGDPILNPNYVNELSKSRDLVSIATIFPCKKIPFIESKVKIHYSLHSVDFNKRKELIPSNTIDIEKSMEYLSKRGNSEIHYTLIKGKNDSDVELGELINLLKKYPIDIKFLEFNETSDLKKSLKLDVWLSKLREILNIKIEHYHPPGRNIGSSCGEFSKHFYKEELLNSVEFKEFEKKFKLF